ncbi:MAG: hypothetical protein ACHWZW_01645 [Spirulina sp.]
MHFLHQLLPWSRRHKARTFVFAALSVALVTVLLQLGLRQSEDGVDLYHVFQPLTTVPSQSAIVETGLFAMNVYDLDPSSNTYYADFYAWFKWQGDIDPLAQLEFSNGVDDWGMVITPTYEEPEILEDNRQYQIWRVEGRFVQPLSLARYPLDRHYLSLILENSAYTIDDLVYVAEPDQSGYSETLAIPGWRIMGFKLETLLREYSTNFGDTRLGDGAQHSILKYSLQIARPPSFFLWKLLLPLVIVVASSWGSLLLNPEYSDSRIALPVTALLTTVFLQESYSSSLPDIGYLVLMDKIYVIAYVLIFLSIAEAILTADWIKEGKPERYHQVIKVDRWLLIGQIVAIFLGAIGLILWS